MTETVLFVHSTGTGPMLWASVPPEVLGGRRAIAPPNLGYPPREPVPRGVRVTAEDDVEAVLSAVPEDAERVHLVGHSYGASLAIRVAERLGARTASLFVYEPVLFGALGRSAPDAEARAEAAFFTEHPWFLGDDARGGTEPWLEIFIDYWNRKGSWSKVPAPMRAHSIAMGWKMYQEVRACLSDERTFAEWKLPAWTTLCRGGRTTAASRAMTLALAQANPHAAVVELADLGHMAPLTSPAPVYAEIARHLARGGAS